MQDLLSLAGTLGFALLPGAVLVPWSFRNDLLEDLGTACTVSLGINSFAVLVLFLAGAYTPLTAWLWAILLAGGSVLLRRHVKRWGPPVSAPHSSSRGPLERGAVLLLLPLLAMILYKSAFLPFYGYDAIASWNRWARDLVLLPERMHGGSLFYPLYNSFGMSFPYMLGGDTAREYFPHLLSFAHLLVLYAALKQWERVLGSSARLVMAGLFLSHILYAYAGTGYADVAAVGFGAWAIALYLQALQGLRSPKAAWAAGLAGATGYLFKQSVLPMIVMVPALCTLFVSRGSFAWRLRLAARLAAGLCLAPLSWNGIAGMPLIGSTLPYVLHGVHGDLSAWEILAAGGERLITTATLYRSGVVDVPMLALVFLFLAAGVLLRGALHAAVGCAGLLNLLIWMGTANYDERGAMLPLAAIGAVSAAGLGELLKRIVGTYRRAGAVFVQAALVGGALCGEYMSTDPQLVRKIDWRPGPSWLQTRPWQSQDEKRALLNADLRDLLDWKRAHPGFKGRLWSSPLLIAAYSPVNATPADQPWLNQIDQGGLQWQKGDYLLVRESAMGSPKPRQGPEKQPRTWGEWIGQMIERGLLRKEGVYGNHHSFEVLSENEREQK